MVHTVLELSLGLNATTMVLTITVLRWLENPDAELVETTPGQPKKAISSPQ